MLKNQKNESLVTKQQQLETSQSVNILFSEWEKDFKELNLLFDKFKEAVCCEREDVDVQQAEGYLKQAYRKLIKSCYPDTYQTLDDQEIASNNFIDLESWLTDRFERLKIELKQKKTKNQNEQLTNEWLDKLEQEIHDHELKGLIIFGEWTDITNRKKLTNFEISEARETALPVIERQIQKMDSMILEMDLLLKNEFSTPFHHIISDYVEQGSHPIFVPSNNKIAKNSDETEYKPNNLTPD